MVKEREIIGWNPKFIDDDDKVEGVNHEDIRTTPYNRVEVESIADESEGVSETTFTQTGSKPNENAERNENLEDAFGIYDVLRKQNSKVLRESVLPSHPSCITLVVASP